MTRLAESGTLGFDISETFDGSAQVGLGQGTINQDHSISYERWSFGRLPVSYTDFSSGVSISCE